MSRLDEYFRAQLAQAGANRRTLRPTDRIAPARARRDGHTLIDFSSNDYLGLSLAPALRDRAAQWAQSHGAGSAASRLVGGTLPLHTQIESRMAAFKQREACLIFASGWQANVGVLAALLKPEDLVFTDRLNHASLHVGIKAAGAREIRFRHNDMDHLATQLDHHRESQSRRFIIAETVYSMDGDAADTTALAALATQHNAFLYLDEAHATGVLGEQGRGLAPASTDLVMGTFSKALGGFGAYIAGSQPLIDYLIQCCSGFIHTTAPPPAQLGAIDAALDLVPTMNTERTHLTAMATRLRTGLHELGHETGPSTTQIVPLILGDAETALTTAARLESAGILVVAIRPPTVPQGSARIRFAVTAAHTESDIDAVLNALTP